MPLFNLLLLARTQNVQSISATPQTTWLATIKCSSCSQPFPKPVEINRQTQVEMQKQHGMANFIAKCKNCDRKGYISILPTSTYKATPNQDGMIKEIIAVFQGRGLEVMGVELQDQFAVKVKDSSTTFDNADFSDLWAEYDDQISGLAQVEQQKLEVVRGKDK